MHLPRKPDRRKPELPKAQVRKATARQHVTNSSTSIVSVELLEPRTMLTATVDAPVDSILTFETQPGIGHPARLASESTSISLADAHEVTGVNVAHDEYELKGDGQTVVIIDSGVAYDHESLGEGLGDGYRVVGGWDFTEEQDADPYDDGPAGFHGTHVAGILAGYDPNGDGTHTGVAPDVDIVALRVFNDQGRGKLSWLESSLDWVIEHVDDYEHPITTVNLSIGTDWNGLSLPEYAKLEDELETLKSIGVFVSVAAGNRFDSDALGLSYPAVSPHVVPVASSNVDDVMSEFSQRHSTTLVAPGESIVSTVPDYLFDFDGVANDYFAASGTSMAAPYVAGASILVREAMSRTGVGEAFGPSSVQAIRNTLEETADTIQDSDTGQTFRRINVAAAVESIFAQSSPLQTIAYQDGRTLFVNGTDGVDEIHVDTFGKVRVNDQTIQFDPDQLDSIKISGSIGDDQLVIRSYVENAQVSFTPGEVRLSADSIVIDAEAMEHISVVAEGTGTHATFRGNDGVVASDALVIKPTHSWMNSGDSVNYIRGAETVVGWANDSTDSVLIYDSPEDDFVTASAASTSLRSLDFHADAYGYSKVVLRAKAGGDDVAMLIGTSGDEYAKSKSNYGSLAGSIEDPLIDRNFFIYAESFEQTEFFGGGGTDSAKVYDSDGDDRIEMSERSQSMFRPLSTSKLNGFEKVEAFASVGHDVASFLGSSDNERFTAKPERSWMEFGNNLNYARDFDAIVIDGGGGADSAMLFDSEGTDLFVADAATASVVGPGFQYNVTSVPHVHAFSRSGDDRVRFADAESTAELFSNSKGVWHKNANQTVIAEGFDRLTTAADFALDQLPDDRELGNATDSVLDWLEDKFF